MLRLSGCSLLGFLLIIPILLSSSSLYTVAITFESRYSKQSMVDARFLTSEAPPMAKTVRHEMEMFGDVRVDNYYWLRNDTHTNPEVISYLKAENSYADQVMSGTKHFEDQLYAEIRARIKEDDISTPVRRGSYYYYTKNLVGKEYVQHCRRRITNTTSPSVYDVMPIGPEAPKEHVLFDENIKAQGHTYYKIGAFKMSSDNNLIAYAEDTRGDEIYTIYVIDANNGTFIGNPLKGATSNIEWAGDDTLLYSTMDETHRNDKVWSHKLLSKQSNDLCLYHENDTMFYLDIKISENNQYAFVGSSSIKTRFIYYLDIHDQEGGLKTLTPHIDGIYTSASHRGDQFFILKTSKELYNSELVYCQVGNISKTKVIVPHRESVEIQYFILFSNHIALYERENGLVKVTINSLPPVGEALDPLRDGQVLEFVDSIYSVYLMKTEFKSGILRFYYSSMRTPPSIYDYDMNLGISVLKNIQTVLGGFQSSNYLMERKWAVSFDGTNIPISIIYKKNLVKLDGSDPLVLYGYGSYGVTMDPSFSESILSLLDRGFVYAIAHVRGGGEMGGKWYEDGKLLKKKNTFIDFIACAEYLIENRYCSKEKLCIKGASAGGLLIGAVMNMRPDLFRVVIAYVPFVDVLTTMLDPTLPLTSAEWEEWGDPQKEEYYYYMKSYSPVDNVKAQKYPNIYVTASLNDVRVFYSEPTKFVAKLRATKTDGNLLLFKCNLDAGHFSNSGRFQNMQNTAFEYAFLLKALNLAPQISS